MKGLKKAHILYLNLLVVYQYPSVWKKNPFATTLEQSYNILYYQALLEGITCVIAL